MGGADPRRVLVAATAAGLVVIASVLADGADVVLGDCETMRVTAPDLRWTAAAAALTGP
jgi:predicted nicotinamide N-methyase